MTPQRPDVSVQPDAARWISAFLEAQAAERNAARNTLLAYGRDLKDFCGWIERRGVLLTEAGERYFEMISEKVEQIVESTDLLRGYHALPVLTVRATPSLATKWLLPRLSGFVDQNPQLEVRLAGTNELTDFTREDVDIEIRHGEGNWPGLVVEGVAQESFLPVCAPAYAAAKSIAISDITRHRLIHSVKSQVQWDQWLASAGIRKDKRWRRVLFDRSHMAIDAAVAGMGIALESNLMMWRELRDGTLVCPVADPPPVTLVSQWLVCPRDHLRHAKVRAFIAWVKKESDAWAASIV